MNILKRTQETEALEKEIAKLEEIKVQAKIRNIIVKELEQVTQKCPRRAS